MKTYRDAHPKEFSGGTYEDPMKGAQWSTVHPLVGHYIVCDYIKTPAKIFGVRSGWQAFDKLGSGYRHDRYFVLEVIAGGDLCVELVGPLAGYWPEKYTIIPYDQLAEYARVEKKRGAGG